MGRHPITRAYRQAINADLADHESAKDIHPPATVADRATFENPHQFAMGIPYVIVNGAVTIENERHTGALAGRVIYGPGKK